MLSNTSMISYCIFSPLALLESSIATWSVQWVFNDSLLVVWDNGTVAIDNQNSSSSLMSSLGFLTLPDNSTMVINHPGTLSPTKVECRLQVRGQYNLASNPVSIAIVKPGECVE